MADWTTIIEIAASSTVLTTIVEAIRSALNKRKTPYDMLKDMLAEQKKFYEERNADYEREKLDSAEKSSVIMQSHFCKHRFKDPDIPCPVDKANDERLKNRCERCNYPSIVPDSEVVEEPMPRMPRRKHEFDEP